jgi:hypothetical protein
MESADLQDPFAYLLDSRRRMYQTSFLELILITRSGVFPIFWSGEN